MKRYLGALEGLQVSIGTTFTEYGRTDADISLSPLPLLLLRPLDSLHRPCCGSLYAKRTWW